MTCRAGLSPADGAITGQIPTTAVMEFKGSVNTNKQINRYLVTLVLLVVGLRITWPKICGHLKVVLVVLTKKKNIIRVNRAFSATSSSQTAAI